VGPEGRKKKQTNEPMRVVGRGVRGAFIRLPQKETCLRKNEQSNCRGTKNGTLEQKNQSGVGQPVKQCPGEQRLFF